jgi:hypothetical protein
MILLSNQESKTINWARPALRRIVPPKVAFHARTNKIGQLADLCVGELEIPRGFCMAILTKDQREVRRLVNELIKQMIALAQIDASMTPARLRDVYWRLTNDLPQATQAINETAFRRLFSFEDKNASSYLTTGGKNARPIQDTHLKRMARALQFLELHRKQYIFVPKNYGAWIAFLREAVKAVKKRTQAAGSTGGEGEAPDIWKQVASFSPEEAIAVLSSRHCEEGIKSESKLHIRENRERLIAEVFDAFVRKPDIETYNSILLVIGYHRLYHPEVDDPRLWDEPKTLIRRKMPERYSAVADKEIGFRSLISADDKRRAYEVFFEIGARLKKYGDITGFAEAAIKMSIVKILEADADAARRILLDAVREYNKGTRVKSEFHMFYADGTFVLGKLYSALCRAEIALGNRVVALGYLDKADRIARASGDFYNLGNVFEDRAVLVMNDGDQSLAENYVANAATCYEAFGDVRRASISRLLLTPAGNWNGRLVRGREGARVD